MNPLDRFCQRLPTPVAVLLFVTCMAPILYGVLGYFTE